MKRLLHIQASPRGELSYSASVAQALVASYLQSHPRDRVKTLDLFKIRLPPFDGDALNAKYAILHGQPHTEEQKEAWEQVEKVINQFKKADKYIISLPMWNFGIPYKLKHYIDVITQPGYTFSFSPQEGYKGLVTGKPIVVVYARGGEYPAGTPYEAYDFQKKYMEHVLGFIGFRDIKSILIEGTLSGREVGEARKKAAIEEAGKIAETF